MQNCGLAAGQANHGLPLLKASWCAFLSPVGVCIKDLCGLCQAPCVRSRWVLTNRVQSLLGIRHGESFFRRGSDASEVADLRVLVCACTQLTRPHTPAFLSFVTQYVGVQLLASEVNKSRAVARRCNCTHMKMHLKYGETRATALIAMKCTISLRAVLLWLY